MKSTSKTSPGLSRLADRRQALGSWGEQAAANRAAALGYEIIARNVRTPFGELDLVLRRAQELVVLEVKTRATASLGAPEISVTPRKQLHLLQSAQHFMFSHPELGQDWRIDVVSVSLDPATGQAQLEWFEDAVHGG